MMFYKTLVATLLISFVVATPAVAADDAYDVVIVNLSLIHI